MSTATSEAITVLAEAARENCALIAGAALIFFDYVMTFGQEVQLFWGERSPSTWLFFANRMLALSYAIISVWSIMNFGTVTSCMANIMAGNLLGILTALISQMVAILRIYAVTGGDRRPVMLLTFLTVFNLVLNLYDDFVPVSYSLVKFDRTATCFVFDTSGSAQDISTKLDIANGICAAAASIMTLAILWRKLYVDHRPATPDILSTKNLSLAALLLRDGTIQLIALLLLNLLQTILDFLDFNAANIVGYLEYSLVPVLISRVLLNVRAAARSTRGEQSQTPSFVRSQRGLQTQADVENMSFELNILSNTEQAQETDHSHPQGSIERHEGIAESRKMADNAAIGGDAHQDVNEEEGMDEVEEEVLSDEEDNA